MHSVIILDEQDPRFNFHPSYENINTQIIIKSGEYGYNFNADIRIGEIGICSDRDMLLLELGCEVGKKYKREIILDPLQLIIYEENSCVPETNPIVPSSLNYTNNLNQITLTVEN